MAKEPKKRRSTERWVNCEAARAEYERVSTDQRKFQKLSELGSGLLTRIRGREDGIWLSTRLMQENSIRQFAELCSVPYETLLANGDGLKPFQVDRGHTSKSHLVETNAKLIFQDFASSYNLLVKQEAPIRLTQVDDQQLQLLSEQYIRTTEDDNDRPGRPPRTMLECIAALLPALAQRGAVTTDRAKATRLYETTTVFERTKAYKLTLPPACLAELPVLKVMTVWVSEANSKDLEHFSRTEPDTASGCYLYLVEPNYEYKVRHAPGVVSGRTALHWLLVNGSRQNGLISPIIPPHEDIDFDKPDPLTLFLSLGAILGPKRDIISLYWPLVPSDDQMFTFSDGRRCRTNDLVGYPIFIVEL